MNSLRQQLIAGPVNSEPLSQMIGKHCTFFVVREHASCGQGDNRSAVHRYMHMQIFSS